MHRLFNNLYAPADTETGGTPDDNLDTLELLNADEAEVPETLELEDKPAPKSKEKDAENVEEDKEEESEVDETSEKEIEDELKEIEEELKGPSEEDLELTTPVRRREILKKYPNLFKDFPYLEKAYYREQQFTELLPTVQDAKIAVEKSRVLDKVEADVMNGDISNLLVAAKQESEDAFLKIADNYLPALMKADKQAYYHVVGNVVKDTIITMVREARQLGEQGEPLQQAANILNQFVFGSNQFTPPKPLSKQTAPEDKNKEIEQRTQQQARVMQQFESVRGELQTKADNTIIATIDQHIDPKGTMTEYIKKNATQDAKKSLEELMSKDQRFLGLLDKLWERAFQTNFSKESTDRIKSAYLSKAKTLLPSAIKKARNDALKGMGRRPVNNTVIDFEEEKAAKTGPIKSGNSTSPSSGKIRSGKDIPKGMSTLDFLNS